MRSNAELNRLAAMATQATAQVFLGNEASAAVYKAATGERVHSDAQMHGFLKKLVKKVGKVVKKAAPVAALFIPGVGPVVSGVLTAVQQKKEMKKAQKAQDAADAAAQAEYDAAVAAQQAAATPPTDMNSPQFAQWATAVGATNTAAAGTPGPLSDPEKQILLSKIQSLQTQAVRQLPPQPQFYPMPQVPAPMQQQMQKQAEGMNPQTMLMIGIPAIIAVLLLAKKK